MADIGEARAGHKTNVTRTDNCKIHKRWNGAAIQSQREGRNELNGLNIVWALLFIVPGRWDRNSNRIQISGMP
jgi:hypothetical protein